MADRRTEIRRGEILRDGAAVVVVGGGPAGSFFALRLLREARRHRRRIRVFLLERKPLAARSSLGSSSVHLCGCKGCAGGISPRLADVLRAEGLQLPPEVVQARIRTLTIQGEWKNIELKVPDDRRMCAVFRGSRPEGRRGGSRGLDEFLLEMAVREGAALVPGTVTELRHTPAGGIQVTYCTVTEEGSATRSLRADFVAIATGVNGPAPGASDGASFPQGPWKVLPR